MDFTFNIYATLLLIFGSMTIALAYFIYARGGKAVIWFSLMMFSNAIWSIAYGFELASSDIEQIKLLLNIEYIGIATVPLHWFLFCLHFSGKECWYKKPLNLTAILIIPIATIILEWTNTSHHLHYESYQMIRNGPFPMIKLVPGVWYRVFTIYFYILLASGCYLLWVKFRKSDPIFRKQNYNLIIAAFIPWIANIAYLLGLKPFGYIDLTPFAFIITSFLIVLGIYKYKLFDIIPLAREKVLELMKDGFLVLDKDYRVIDYNQSIRTYLNTSADLKLIGSSLEDLFPNQPSLLEMLNTRASGKIEFDANVDGQILSLEADIIILDDNKIHNEFIIIKLQDLTAYKREVQRSKQQAAELERLNQLKDRIFSIMAHDLRGPLVNLSEVLKMIAKNQISTSEFKNISPTLSKDIIYTTDLLENILHWSRSQLKGFGITKERFNIRNLILNEINYHLPAAELKKINIIHDVFPNEMAYADILMIQIVVRNILNNAIKFCHEGCEILITANYHGNNTMLICIEDNGIGMKQEIMNKLFTDENVTTRGTLNEKGTGLGLIVCKDFMERNDGQITATSVEGKGSKFYLTLPIDHTA
jgi:signal transduction histidine kinase